MLALTVLLTACPAKKPSNDGKNGASSNIDGGNQQQGGYDWGGGEVIRSSPSLVKRTIELAQTNAGEQAVEKSIFRQFLIWSLTATSGSQRFNTAILFPGSGDGLKEDVVRLPLRREYAWTLKRPPYVHFSLSGNHLSQGV